MRARQLRSAVIVGVVRSPVGRGKKGGALAEVHPVQLLADTISGLMERVDLSPTMIDDVIAGCVGQVADQAGNVARTASLVAGLPETVPGTTLDRQCGSGQQAVAFAAQAIMSGVQDAVLAVGVESMSRVPMASAVADGDPFGALAARYPNGMVHQGISAELIAGRRSLTRGRLDEYAAQSHQRAAEAAGRGAFDAELVPVRVVDATVTADETIRPTTTAAGLAGLSPSFTDATMAARFPEISWSITPGNSSPLSDGAAAALIVADDVALRLGLEPLARLHSFSVVGFDPIEMLTGVLPATEKVLQASGLELSDIDHFEVNEAFASVPLAWLDEFGVDEARLNPLGGAIALGHPLGASGVKLLATMVHGLRASGGKYGLQTMCEGAGMANATIVELI
jgi:acetyl-CoA acyltransferase